MRSEQSAMVITSSSNLDNTFLFNVVEDPLERANLKDRQKDVYHRLVREWNDWNASIAAGESRRVSRIASMEGTCRPFGAKESDQMPDLPDPSDD